MTLGAEEELHLIDLESWKLSARAPQLLAKLPPESYGAELQRTTVETNTEVVRSLDALRGELLRLRKGVVDVAEPVGLGVAAVGTAPRSVFADFELTSTGRFGRMQEQYRLLVDEQLICGLQIHVGVADREVAVQIAQRVERELPVLLALSTSSPYWNGSDTGYASIRSLIWQRWPSAGATGPLASAAAYDELLSDLIGTGVIADSKMAYFDIRPSSHAPTLELRVCDACPIVDDAILIAGVFRAAVRAAELDIEAGRPYLPLPAPIHRAAMWQAARSGLRGKLLDASDHPKPMVAAEAVQATLDRLRPQLEELGDWEEVSELAGAVLARGSSADRQRAIFAERGELDDVVEHVVRETHGPASGPPPAIPALTRYAVRAGDEAVGPGAQPRPAYQDLVAYWRQLGYSGIEQKQRERDRWIDEHGMTFTVHGEELRFPVDLMPRVISAYEWNELSAGLTQRARAIEAFLQDVYGERRAVRDGIVPENQVVGGTGWREEATRLPSGAVRAPIMGFDLIRNEFGGWRVLEDNVRTPSGFAFATATRHLMDAVLPDLPRPAGLIDPDLAVLSLRETLVAHADRTGGSDSSSEPVVALFSDGVGTPAWFEHRTLANTADLLLVGPDDLLADGGVVRHAGTRERIHVLYLRLDGELVDIGTKSGMRIGEAIMDVAAAGGVVLANAPGNGVADDKAMYCYVPELIGYYLDERPLIESVPTYRTSDAAERRGVLERVGELVTKPVDGYGGRGVLIGPAATAATVAARRAEIADHPENWIAQEVVTLSSLPTFSGQLLGPRHVDLRAFVFLTGTGEGQAQLAPLALTRVAPEGSLVVNSSQGGGAKDTWILSDVAQHADTTNPDGA
ncbi:YbdK family carboxylate-amine ligase [Naasia lichenicola]|uniref:Putative glutamate--cysteine ligase 2 n=1 Tax=Naasia lichenicola TaxID=2565933 RepID=A0A4S4FSF7_9MICO|nr:YbdK family carboxylate-amine ligase [Naasia lichenicola]